MLHDRGQGRGLLRAHAGLDLHLVDRVEPFLAARDQVGDQVDQAPDGVFEHAEEIGAQLHQAAGQDRPEAAEAVPERLHLLGGRVGLSADLLDVVVEVAQGLAEFVDRLDDDLDVVVRRHRGNLGARKRPRLSG